MSNMSGGIEVDSASPTEYTFLISKTGDGDITLAREITRDNAPYLQTMTVRYTADSSKDLYNVDVTADTADIVIADNGNQEPEKEE